MRRSLVLLALATGLLLAAVPAFAQSPKLLNYQGVLTDALGAPVADGSYDLTFKIYSVATGGAALWTETHTGTTIARGGFSAILGGTTALTLAFDRQYWLGITVAPDTEMAPRVQLTATPYAITAAGLSLPFLATVGSSSPAFKVGNTGTGPAMVADGRLEMGSTAKNGEWAVLRSGLTTDMVHAGSHPRGGYTDWLDEAGVVIATVDADLDGTGGLIQVKRNSTDNGFVVDGNVNGTEEPTVSITGSTRSAIFRMGNSGNSSVALPDDAIGSAEILDEPGLASQAKSTMSAPLGLFTICSRAITVPADGWILAFGTLTARVTRNSGGGSTDIQFGVSASSTAFATSNRLIFDSAMTLGLYYEPIAVQGIFQVTAGSNTIYLLGDLNNGVVSIDDAQLSLVYLPTSYGTVVPSLTADRGSESSIRTAREVRP